MCLRIVAEAECQSGLPEVVGELRPSGGNVNLWRETIHYAKQGEESVGITKEIVLKAAEYVYKDYPEFYRIVKEFLK